MFSRFLVSKVPYHARSLSSRAGSRIDQVKSVGVAGAGQMGTGIAIVTAFDAGLPVVVYDNFPSALAKSKDFISSFFEKQLGKGRITEEEVKKAEGLLTYTQDLGSFSDVDFVIEAATEDTELKLNLFREMSKICKDDTILSSNTSSIPITKIAAATANPENVIGNHYMNPVPIMKLVEIIPAMQTSEATLNTTLDLAEKQNKTTAISKDMPGFIANRLLMPYINEAAMAVEEGLGTVEDIDKVMKLGTNVPMGPLTLADFIGLDTCLAIMRVLHAQFGDSKYRPSVQLVKMVDAGWLGKKSGRGFYDYSKK